MTNRRILTPFLVLAATAALLVSSAGMAAASDDTQGVQPGVMTVTAGGQCTANFVFSDGTDFYIGQAAHCAGTGAATDTNGCANGSLPLGTEVEIEGADFAGTLAYSSWIAMNRVNETDENACRYNDFALVKIDDRDYDQINTSLPHFGGPVGVETDGCTAGEDVYTYGNSSLRLGISTLSPKAGTCLGTSGGGWTHTVYTATPGIPGDSGSPVLDADGNALGVLVTVAIAPLAGSNGVTDVNLALQYANTHGERVSNLSLQEGSEPFTNGGLLGIL